MPARILLGSWFGRVEYQPSQEKDEVFEGGS